MKVFYYASLLFCILFMNQTVYSQQSIRKQIDSLFKIYKTNTDPHESLKALTLLGQRYRYVDTDSAKHLLRKAINMHKKQEPSHYLFAFSYNVISDIYKKQKEADSAKYFYEEAYRIFNKKDNKDFLLAIAPPYGQFLANHNEVEKGIKVFEDAIAIAQETESYPNLSYLYFYLGNVFYEVQNDLNKARKFYYDAKVISERLSEASSDRLLSFLLLKLAKLNFDEGNIQASIKDAKECISYSKKANLPNQSIASYNILCRALIEQGDIKKAKEYNDLVHEFNTENIDLTSFIESEIISQTISSKSGNANHCIQKGELLLSKYDLQLSHDNKYRIFKNLSDCYSAGNKDDIPTLKYRDSAMYYIQKMLNNKYRKSLTDLYNQQILKEEESKRKVLLLEKEISDNKLKNQKLFTIILFILFLMGAVLAVIFYRSLLFKKKNNIILEEKVQARTKELEESNTQLQQSIYELRTLNYLASHDLKEPVRKVYDYLALIRLKLPPEVALGCKEQFLIIERNVEQLYTLVEDFTNYISMSNDSELPIQTVDLNKIITTIDSSLLIIENDFKGDIISDDLPKIKSNDSAIFIILKNVIANGLKFNTSDDPTVSVSSKIINDKLYLKISDNGIGIEEKHFEKIFELTSRLHNRSKYIGSGIGLSLVKILVKKLQGEITIKSEVGKGSEFTIILPYTAI